MELEIKKDLLTELLKKEKKEVKNNKKIKLIVGLGNPDKKYSNTYHNIGFYFVDRLAEKFSVKISKKECKSLTGEYFISREETLINKEGKIESKVVKEKIIFAKPQTYMNLSGEAVLELSKKYKIKPEEILIVLDDIDLEPGTYRYRENGSGGTHNGLRNIVQLLKTMNCKRIRIGIGRDERMDLADYVLSKISKNNLEKINEAVERAIDFLETIF